MAFRLCYLLRFCMFNLKAENKKVATTFTATEKTATTKKSIHGN